MTSASGVSGGHKTEDRGQRIGLHVASHASAVILCLLSSVLCPTNVANLLRRGFHLCQGYGGQVGGQDVEVLPVPIPIPNGVIDL